MGKDREGGQMHVLVAGVYFPYRWDGSQTQHWEGIVLASQEAVVV